MTEQQISGLLNIVRRTTIYVKLLPFLYVFTYVICLISYFFISDEAQTVLDMLFYVSPVMVVSTLIFSVLFKLCAWHKLECALPLLPQVFVIADTFYPLTEVAAKINVATVCAMLFLSVLNGYFTFKCSKP